MSDPADIPDDEIDWERVADRKAEYSAVFAMLDRRQLHLIHDRISALEEKVAHLEGPQQPNGRGPYV